jgi:flagellar motor switch protein FliG
MQLGQITPMSPSGNMPRRQVTSAEKAAIIVRFLMTEGAELPLTELPQDLQEELTHQMGSLRRIDRDTLISVVEEFANELEMTGLTFPRGVAGALTALDGKISARAAAQIRKRTGVRANTDPWDVLRDLEPEKLLELIEGESTEVAAVLLSKIDVKTAAPPMPSRSPVPSPLTPWTASGGPSWPRSRMPPNKPLPPRPSPA